MGWVGESHFRFPMAIKLGWRTEVWVFLKRKAAKILVLVRNTCFWCLFLFFIEKAYWNFCFCAPLLQFLGQWPEQLIAPRNWLYHCSASFFFRYWNVWTWVCLEEEKREDGSKNGNKMACGGWHVLCVLHFLLILTTFHETSKDLLHLQIAKPNSPWTLLPLGCSRLSSLNTHRKPFLTVSVSSLPMQREECTAECVCTIPHWTREVRET